jgi:hypothetical protein
MMIGCLTLRIGIAGTIVSLLLCGLALSSCRSPSTEEDQLKLQELRTAYLNRYRFEFETGGLYLNAWSLVDKEPSKDEAKAIYKTFWFKDGQKRTDNTGYVYLNVFNNEGAFQFQVFWDPKENDFGFSQKPYY